MTEKKRKLPLSSDAPTHTHLRQMPASPLRCGEMPFGDRIGGDAKGGKTSSCHSSFGLYAAG